jgi:hypothetical protein
MFIKEPYFQAEIRWFYMILHISHLQVVATIIYKYLYAVLWIRDFLVRIRIRGSVPLSNVSGSESCKFIAHLVRSQVTELREGSLFTCLKKRLGINFGAKKRSFGQFLT